MLSWLYVVKNLNKKIAGLEEKLNRLRSLVQAKSARLDGMPKSQGRESPVEKVANLILETEGEIAALKKILEECRCELALKFEDSLADEREKTVMTLRYVEGLTVREIAERLKYCEVRIYQIMKLAKEELLYSLVVV